MNKKSIHVALLALIASVLLAGCQSQRVWQRRDPLALSQVDDPMPHLARTHGSIYRQGSDINLYGNSRAHRVGDLLTVHVDENLNAQDRTAADTNRRNTVQDDLALTGVVAPGMLRVNGDNRYSGFGQSQQSNTITGDITVMVIKVLSNGDLVVRGYKTMTLGYGVEKIGISGIVRQEDINSEDNSVLSSKIADAHIVYLGRGDLSDSAHKGWLSRITAGPAWPE